MKKNNWVVHLIYVLILSSCANFGQKGRKVMHTPSRNVMRKIYMKCYKTYAFEKLHSDFSGHYSYHVGKMGESYNFDVDTPPNVEIGFKSCFITKVTDYQHRQFRRGHLENEWRAHRVRGVISIEPDE